MGNNLDLCQGSDRQNRSSSVPNSKDVKYQQSDCHYLNDRNVDNNGYLTLTNQQLDIEDDSCNPLMSEAESKQQNDPDTIERVIFCCSYTTCIKARNNSKD
jgi:hypothetical protein